MTRRVLLLSLALLGVPACSSDASERLDASGSTSGSSTTAVSTSTSSGADATTTSAADPATTAAPATEAPTTAAPTTAAPATAPPVTASPATAAPTTVPCRVVTINDTMRRGDCGDGVVFLQERLTLLGFPAAADGRFGAGTETAVKNFQTSRGLVADGVVGPATWEKLVEGGIGD